MRECPICPKCGSKLPAAAPLGLCPRCLLQNVLGSGTDPDDHLRFSIEPIQPGRVLEPPGATISEESHVLPPETAANDPAASSVRPYSPEMASPADRPPSVQLLGEITRGGMGAILKGRDPILGRDLAVKVLLQQHRENHRLVRRFVEEAQITGQLQHPGIIPVYELGIFGDSRPYFTMKLVKGRTLAELLAERRDPAQTSSGETSSLERSHPETDHDPPQYSDRG